MPKKLTSSITEQLGMLLRKRELFFLLLEKNVGVLIIYINSSFFYQHSQND